ncbi:BTAD domain-containing putative transcriptional regulator [Streptomyces sp. NPDC051636]|uniref:BTAD domain-containing putative transcriptional regulator n=1 Tax=Streptomyces sp. NPDC051636 TaxID=3365663 RepID=UPI00379ED1F4
MRFEVLGPVTVRTGDGNPVSVPEAKVRALLADLLVHHGRPVPVDRLIDDLWGESLPGNPGNTLQTKVSQLRRALAKGGADARALVEYGPAGYTLRVPEDAVDSGRFMELTARARTAADPRAKVSLLSEALGLWRGAAFADFRDEGFAQAAIARLEEQRLTAQEDLAELRLELGEHSLMADELGELVAAHPLRRRLRAAHMLALYRTGRQSEALDAYQDLRRRFADELGIDPDAELAALHQAILRQDPGLAPVPTPATTSARPQTNLPTPVSSLIGRHETVARVCALVRGNRLVTLTGPGGVGKTRIALAAAARLADAAGDAPDAAEEDVDDVRADGVWFVELGGTSGGVAENVAGVLGLRDDDAAGVAGLPRGAGTTRDRLAEAIAQRRLLLVLDNCEHLVEEVAVLADHLLRGAPGLRILATSQEPLAISGEILHPVEPLADREAMALFAARAAATTPGFALTPETSEAVALICRRLDGIPLALELAATRVRTLGVHTLADRLHDRFRLLNQMRRDAPARQRTLRAMIDWSWELLSPPERIVLRRLAVFAGGFTLHSAERVCAPPGATAGEGDVAADDMMDLVTRLVDRSLVVAAFDSDGTRFRMLESVTAYALERLDEAGETKELRRRHALHCTDMAEHVAPLLHGRDQRHWLRLLDSETANLRAALDHTVADSAADLALRLVNAQAWYWYLRGRIGEAVRSLGCALEGAQQDPVVECADGRETGAPPHDASPQRTPPHGAAAAEGRGAARAGARVRRAAFALLTGDDTHLGDTFEGADARGRWLLAFARCGFGDRTTRDLDALPAEFRASGDRWGEAAALSTRATWAIYEGDLAALRRNAESSAALFAELGDLWGRLQASEQLGVLAEIAGDYEGAARLHRHGLRSAEELQLWTQVSFRLARLGRVALLTGDDAQATEFHERARRLAAEQSHRPAEQFAAMGLAMGARRRGDLAAAEAHLLPWLEWNRRLGVASGEALTLAQLGFVAEQRGDARLAETLHRESLAAAGRTGDPRALALALEGLAGARATDGHMEYAASLLGTAAAIRDSVDAPLPQGERADVDRAAARARDALGEDGFAAAFDHGRGLTADHQIALLDSASTGRE